MGVAQRPYRIPGTVENIRNLLQFSSVAHWCLTLQSNGLQHARTPYPSSTPRVYSDSCPSNRWWHPTISSSVISFSSRLQSLPASGSSNESVLHIRWPKYWSFSFSISPSNEYSGLISLRMDWLDIVAVQGTLKSLLQHHSSKASIISAQLSLGEGNGTHSSTVARRIPWMEEPGRLQSMGLLRVRHNWATSLSLSTFMHWRRKWHPIPVFLPGESHGRRSLIGCSPWGRTESDTTEAT